MYSTHGRQCPSSRRTFQEVRSSRCNREPILFLRGCSPDRTRGSSLQRLHAVRATLQLQPGGLALKLRSFRYSSSGLPVLNLDVGYSAFLASGPAVDVIAKIIGMPATRGRGGYTGGIQPKRELTEMNERDIARAKSKLRGAKVIQLRSNDNTQLTGSLR